MLVLREIEAETRADRQALATMIGQVALDTVGGRLQRYRVWPMRECAYGGI
jgi:hypothetical protein